MAVEDVKMVGSSTEQLAGEWVAKIGKNDST